MGWVWLLERCPWLIDKLMGEYIKKKIEEQTGKDKQIEVLKNILVEEIREKHLWKEEVQKVKVEERKRFVKFFETTIEAAVHKTWEYIEKDYILTPKIPLLRNALQQALLGRQTKNAGKKDE